MTRNLLFSFLIIFISLPLLAQQQASGNITSDSQIYNTETGLSQFLGNVSVSFSDAVLKADFLEVNAQTKDFTARGNVILQDSKGSHVEGQEAQGNLEDRLYYLGPFTGSNKIWYIKGSSAEARPDNTLQVSETKLSTCKYIENSFYHLKAEEVTFLNDNTYKAENVWAYLGPIPVMYFPYYKGGLDPSDGEYQVRAGYTGDFGAFAKIGRTWRWAPGQENTLRLDLLSKKGVGISNETEILTANSQTKLLIYGINDRDNDDDGDIDPITGEDLNGRFELEEQRYRVKLEHRWRPLDKLTISGQVDVLSDFQFNEVYFREDYTRNQQRFSYLDLSWLDENYYMSLYYRPKVNDFYTVTERSPELRIAMPRQAIGDSSFYYMNYNTAANLRTSFRETDEHRASDGTIPENDNYSAWRLDSLHMLYYQTMVDDWLSIVPRLGFRVTHYSDSSETALNNSDLLNLLEADAPYYSPLTDTKQYDNDGGNQTRLLLEAGLKTSFKSYKTWYDYQSSFWGAKGLRHVVEPYINLNSIPYISEDRDNLYFFDEIDRISRQTLVRVGIDQRFQTKKNDSITTFARIENYLDIHLDNEGDAGKGAVDFGTDIEFTPTNRDFSVFIKSLYDLDSMDLNVFTIGTVIGKGEPVKFGVSYNYRRAYTQRDVYSNGSTLTSASASSGFARTYEKLNNIDTFYLYKFHPRAAMKVGVRFDIEENEFDREYFEFVRIYQCWTAVLRAEHQIRGEDEQFNFTIGFIINAFPNLSFGSIPGVGEGAGSSDLSDELDKLIQKNNPMATSSI